MEFFRHGVVESPRRTMSLQIFQDDGPASDVPSAAVAEGRRENADANTQAEVPGGGGKDEFAWENKKENFKPRVKGRNVRKLNAFGESSAGLMAAKTRLDEQRDAFEQAIAMYDGPDPLKAWLKYIKWAETEFPSSTAKALPLYERCTRALFKHEKYQNNLKYLSVWLKFADELDDASEVFRFLYSNKIGAELSFFYVAWALVEEEKKRYGLVDKIYCRGIALGAQPERDLEVRHNQFKRRMSRHWLQQAGVGDESHPSQEQETDRGAFTMLTTGSAATSKRTAAGGRLDENSGCRVGGRTGGGLGGMAKRPPTNQVTTMGNFQIFVEEGFREEGDGESVPQKDELLKESAAPWADFGKMTDRKKENVGKVTPWNQGGLYEGRPPAAVKPRAPPQQAGFSICVDEEFDSLPTDIPAEEDASAPSARKETLRQRLEGASVRTTEEQEVWELKANPFKNYEDTFGRGDTAETVETELMKKLAENPPRPFVSKAKKNKVQGMKNLVPAKITKRDSSKNKIVMGFQESLLTDATGNEMCFQEVRANVWREKMKKKREEEERKATASRAVQRSLQTSADDMVTEMRRKPDMAKKRMGRRATLSTITPQIQQLYLEAEDDGDDSNDWTGVSEEAPSSANVLKTKMGGTSAKSTASKVLSFANFTEEKVVASTASKVLQFDDDSVGDLRPAQSTACKVLQFGVTSDSDAKETPAAYHATPPGTKPETASRKLLFSITSVGSMPADSFDREAMTQNMKEAMEDIGGLFQSSPIDEKQDTVGSIRFIEEKHAFDTQSHVFGHFDDTLGNGDVVTPQYENRDDMTMNMKAAMDDLGGLFCSPTNHETPKLTAEEAAIPVRKSLSLSSQSFGDPAAVDDSATQGASTKFLLFHKDGGEAAPLAVFDENAGSPRASGLPSSSYDVAAAGQGTSVFKDEESVLSNPNATATGTINFDVFDEGSKASGRGESQTVDIMFDQEEVFPRAAAGGELIPSLFQMIDEDKISDEDDEDDLDYRVNGENETPPRGLSSRGRRVRTLDHLEDQDIVLGELPILREEGADSDEGYSGDEENYMGIPVVPRLTTRASSPLALSQRSVHDEVPSASPHDALSDSENARARTLMFPDLTDPKYDFEIFEDENTEN